MGSNQVSVKWVEDTLRVAWRNHAEQNYTVSIPMTTSLLDSGALDLMAEVECHLLLATSGAAEALEHGVSANIMIRQLYAQDTSNDNLEQLFHASQEILRQAQQSAREEREERQGQQSQQMQAVAAASPPPSSSLPSASLPSPGPSTPTGPSPRPRRRLSAINSDLATIEEEDTKAYPAAPIVVPGPGSFHNRRRSSLARAAHHLAYAVRRSM